MEIFKKGVKEWERGGLEDSLKTPGILFVKLSGRPPMPMEKYLDCIEYLESSI